MKIDRILVAEDEKQILRSLVTILECAGYRVDGAKDGHEAMDKALKAHGGSEPVDLLLTDIFMPGMTGLELIGKMRNRGLRFPVIAITGRGDDKMAAQLRKLGCLHFIDKPFEPDELLESVAEALPSSFI